MMSAQDADALVHQLSTDGFVVVRKQIRTDALGALREETGELLDQFAAGHRSPDFWCYQDAGTGSAMLFRVHNLEKQGLPRCTALFRSGPLHDLALMMIGPVDATVCAMVIKAPGGAEVPWHRDRTDAPPTSVINLSLVLDESTVDNGCLEVVPRSHLLPNDVDVIGTRDSSARRFVPAHPGDVVIHDVRLVHGSGPNPSTTLRRSIIVEFATRRCLPESEQTSRSPHRPVKQDGEEDSDWSEPRVQ